MIPISLTDSKKGEQTAQTCANASYYSYELAPCRRTKIVANPMRRRFLIVEAVPYEARSLILLATLTAVVCISSPPGVKAGGPPTSANEATATLTGVVKFNRPFGQPGVGRSRREKRRRRRRSGCGRSHRLQACGHCRGARGSLSYPSHSDERLRRKQIHLHELFR